MVKRTIIGINGYWFKSAILSWMAFVTYYTITNTQWIVGHEAWTDTTLTTVLRDFKRIEERQIQMEEKLDRIAEHLFSN